METISNEYNMIRRIGVLPKSDYLEMFRGELPKKYRDLIDNVFNCDTCDCDGNTDCEDCEHTLDIFYIPCSHKNDNPQYEYSRIYFIELPESNGLCNGIFVPIFISKINTSSPFAFWECSREYRLVCECDSDCGDDCNKPCKYNIENIYEWVGPNYNREFLKKNLNKLLI